MDVELEGGIRMQQSLHIKVKLRILASQVGCDVGSVTEVYEKLDKDFSLAERYLHGIRTSIKNDLLHLDELAKKSK